MPFITLTDLARDIWVDHWSLSAADLGLGNEPRWSISKRTLRGGRRDGVDLIHLDNGSLALSILPTRGMNIWKGHFHADSLGWHSPIHDGPVHPSHVNLWADGGIGWLDGFDELLARCGLENNGAPYVETVIAPDGSHKHVPHPLHGKIANRPAHYVTVEVEDRPPHKITLIGHVEEARLFGVKVHMVTKMITWPGANQVTVRDEFTNVGDLPVEMQILYHWNFGSPYLGAGSRVLAPAKQVVPRDARAVEGIAQYDTYGPPEPGFAEQCYYYELIPDAASGRTLTMLRDRAGTKAVVLRFAPSQLPSFTVWKNTNGVKEGYVTGLEPATNYPNARPFEAEHGRVVQLAPGGPPFVAETVLEVHDSAEGVAAVEGEVRKLQGANGPVVQPRPIGPFAPE